MQIPVTAHMTSNTGNLSSSVRFSGKGKIYIGDGAGLPISRMGTTVLPSTPSRIELQTVIIAQLKKNFISGSQLTEDDSCILEFSSSNSR